MRKYYPLNFCDPWLCFVLGWSWLQGLFWATTPLLGFSHFEHTGPGFWCDIALERSSASLWYTSSIFILCYFLPLSVIVGCYVKINLKIREAAKSSVSATTAKLERDVLRQSYAMVGGFVVAWTPYAVFGLIAISCDVFPFSQKAYLSASLIAKSSIFYNAFIYIFMNKQVSPPIEGARLLHSMSQIW